MSIGYFGVRNLKDKITQLLIIVVLLFVEHPPRVDIILARKKRHGMVSEIASVTQQYSS